MTRINEPDNFSGRVNLAASYIAAERRTTRTFDSCFENHDGDAVAVALYRRAEKRPDGALARNLWRYLARETVEAAAREYAHIPTRALPALAAKLRARARESFRRTLAAQDARQEGDAARADYETDCARTPFYHDGTPRREWSALSEVARDSWRRGARDAA